MNNYRPKLQSISYLAHIVLPIALPLSLPIVLTVVVWALVLGMVLGIGFGHWFDSLCNAMRARYEVDRNLGR